MTEPPPEAYEAAARAQIEAVGKYHPPFTPDELAVQVLMRAERRDVVAAVDAVWDLAEATVRAKVAAEIRAGSPPVSLRATETRRQTCDLMVTSWRFNNLIH